MVYEAQTIVAASACCRVRTGRGYIDQRQIEGVCAFAQSHRGQQPGADPLPVQLHRQVPKRNESLLHRSVLFWRHVGVQGEIPISSLRSPQIYQVTAKPPFEARSEEHTSEIQS